ncbi:MAG: glucose 1-dehydrogenase [Myxococcota bacterium]
MSEAAAGRLAGKVAIVTGAARGIGAATAERFVEEGARVVLADRREEEGAAQAESLCALRADSARFVPLDITSETAWADAMAATTDAFGGVDVLVNNAGMIRVKPLEETDLETFRQVLDTNLVGAFLGIKAVLGAMRERGGGSIVNFSSVQGLEGRENMSAYASSKFGVRGLTRTAAIELGPAGIRVNVVVPGPTKTKMTERKGWTDAEYDAAYGGYPLGRMANAREIADVVLFLASDESAFCTGADYVVDGGVLVGKPRA